MGFESDSKSMGQALLLGRAVASMVSVALQVFIFRAVEWIGFRVSPYDVSRLRTMIPQSMPVPRREIQAI